MSSKYEQNHESADPVLAYKRVSWSRASKAALKMGMKMEEWRHVSEPGPAGQWVFNNCRFIF